MSAAWSVPWSISDADELLFQVRPCTIYTVSKTSTQYLRSIYTASTVSTHQVGSHWLVMDRRELLGSTAAQDKWSSGVPYLVLASSEQCDPHKNNLIARYDGTYSPIVIMT